MRPVLELIEKLNLKVSRLAEKIINTSVFKRLKSIKQLQAVHEVFPTGNHSRSSRERENKPPFCGSKYFQNQLIDMINSGMT